MIKSKYFKIHELVPKKMYTRYGEDAWRYVDIRLIESIDLLKEKFSKGTMTINNYYWGGSRSWSGIRTPESKYYNYGSQHSFANAFDIVFSEYQVEEIRHYIMANRELFPHVNGLELGVSWLHIDIRNSDKLITFTA